MGKYKYKKYSKGRTMSKQELFGWIITGAVFVIVLVVQMSRLFIVNCVFEWPPRFDVSTCWNEQKEPATQSAADAASNFMPKLRY